MTIRSLAWNSRRFIEGGRPEIWQVDLMRVIGVMLGVVNSRIAFVPSGLVSDVPEGAVTAR